MVGADAHGDPALLALQDQRREALFDAGDLGGVVLVGVLADAEELLVGEVARVHADLVDVLGGFHRRRGAEVDVGDERHRDALRAEAPLDLADRLGVGRRRGGDAYDLAAGLDQADGLGQGPVHVLGTRGRHGLHADRLRAAYGNVANLDFAALAPLVREAAETVRRGSYKHLGHIIGRAATLKRDRHRRCRPDPGYRPPQLIAGSGDSRSLNEMITINVSRTTMPTKW